MSVQLNHTIVHCTDQAASATFLAEVLGVDAPRRFGPFLEVKVANGVSLDFQERTGPVEAQHYAFLVAESEFDEIFGRIAARGRDHWADPHLSRPGEINHNDGGRGTYFRDPNGHLLEILTRPYGSGAPS
jgi:catechol 2,3-dioxygenase-like lactoylglutathione lyase family enzyme